MNPAISIGWRRIQGLTLLALALAGLLAQPAPAAESVLETSSLKYVPEDASFYWSRMRMREQVEAVINSRAIAKILDLPWIKEAREQAAKLQEEAAREAGAPDVEQVKSWFELPENIELQTLLLDAVSNEVFVYGDSGFAELMAAMNGWSNEMRALQAEQARVGADDEALNRKNSELLARIVKQLRVPSTVIGFKLKDDKPATSQLARLEAILSAQLEMQPPEWHGRLKREKVGATEFLTLRLDGTLIPWDQIPREDRNTAEFEQVKQSLSKLTLVVSIGIRDGYLLVAIGDSTARLQALGSGKPLAGRKELAPVVQHASERFTSISYVSERMMREGNTLDKQLDGYVSMAEAMLPLSELDPAMQEEIIGDVRKLVDDLKKYIPKPGAHTSFSFISQRGLEGYTYDWSEHLAIDGSQKLTILDHLGGKPLAFAAGRTKYAPQDYELTVKWIQRGVYYFEQLGLPQLEPEQQELYQKIRTDMTPLAERLDQVTKLSWIPAFKDGQSAFVMDAKLTSAKWHEQMPPAATPLPILEFGWVYGVSDAELVKVASSDYFEIAREAVNKLHAIVPDAVPEFAVAAPQAREFPEGTVYYYTLPREWGLDTQIAPNAALSKDFLALTLLPKFGLRLLKPTPLEVEGPVANHDRPLASASYFDFAGLLDALVPWMDYGVDQRDAIAAAAKAAAEAAGQPQEEAPDETAPEVSPEEVKANTRFVFDFLKCLRTMSSVSYFEEGALVTHSEWHLVDQQ
jgi:hypothetical protein